MNNKEIIRFLWDKGHFPDGIVVSDLEIFTISDEPVQYAIKSYKDFFLPEYTRLSPGAEVNGHITPSFKALLEMPRCGLPDFTTEDTGRGSWPVGCHPEYPDIHSFALYIDKSNMPSFLRNVFDAAWLLCRQAYADIGIAFFEVKDKSRANTVVTWTRGRGWIGLAIVPRSPQCRETIWAKFDTSYSPSDLLNQWARLLAHEFCHNMGLSHSRGGIMNPSIIRGPFTPTAWRGDPSESALTRFFGGKPIQLEPGPNPDPDPPGPSEYWFKGEFELMKGEQSLGKYILTPKPRV